MWYLARIGAPKSKKETHRATQEPHEARELQKEPKLTTASYKVTMRKHVCKWEITVLKKLNKYRFYEWNEILSVFEQRIGSESDCKVYFICILNIFFHFYLAQVTSCLIEHTFI